MKVLDDLDMYAYRNGLPKWCAVFLPLIYITTWPVLCSRFQHCLHYRMKIPVLQQLFMIIGYFMKVFIVITTGITISHKTSIGKGIFFSHIGSLVSAMKV